MEAIDIIRIKPVKTPRKMPRELFDIILKKAIEIDKDRLELAYLTGDALTIAGIAGDAMVALNIREKTNNNDGYLVELIQKVSGGKKGYAWCMYFEQCRFAFAENLTGVTCLYPSTGSCADARGRMPKALIIKRGSLVYGDNSIKKYPDTGTGHTGMHRRFIKFDTIAEMNEGNTTSGKAGDKVIREGGGSYRTERNIADGTWIMHCRPFPLLNDQVITPPKLELIKSDYPQPGEMSDRVASMQKAANAWMTAKGSTWMKAKGLEFLTVDGDFGPITLGVIQAIQKEIGLAGSGIPGKRTMEALGSNIFESLAGYKEGSKSFYRVAFKQMVADPGLESKISYSAKIVLKYKARYEVVAKATGLPWFVIGVIHMKEASCKFDTVLHNGEKLSDVNARGTVLVPKGRGKGKNWTWEDAAIDAINMNPSRWAELKTGTMKIEDILYPIERYNGTGYIDGKGKDQRSVYIWAQTSIALDKGKYVADGKYDPLANANAATGVAPMLKWLHDNGHIKLDLSGLDDGMVLSA